MDRASLNYWVDLGLLAAFLACFVTGLLKLPALISYLSLHKRALPYYEITWIHDFSGVVLGILILAHVLLHWDWLVAKTRLVLKRKT